jgi:hypothetical protein
MCQLSNHWFDFREFDIGDFMKNCQENPNFGKMEQKYQAFYMKI